MHSYGAGPPALLKFLFVRRPNYVFWYLSQPTVLLSRVSLVLRGPAYRNYPSASWPVNVFALHCCADCLANFTRIPSVNGSCYKLVTTSLSWTDAGQNCRSLHPDAHLVVISDAQEQSAAAGMIASSIRQFLFSSFRFDCFTLVQTLHSFWLTVRCLHSAGEGHTPFVMPPGASIPIYRRRQMRHGQFFFFFWGGDQLKVWY